MSGYIVGVHRHRLVRLRWRVGPARGRVRKPATSTIVKPAAQACSSRRTPVPTSNVALFEAAYQAYVERGDLDVFYRTLDPDVEWRAWNDEGDCLSRDEVMAVIRSALHSTAEWQSRCRHTSTPVTSSC